MCSTSCVYIKTAGDTHISLMILWSHLSLDRMLIIFISNNKTYTSNFIVTVFLFLPNLNIMMINAHKKVYLNSNFVVLNH